MYELTDRLADLHAGTADTPSDDVVQGDLHRAHAALARRGRRRGAAGIAVLAVAGVGAVATVAALHPTGSTTAATAAKSPATHIAPAQAHPRSTNPKPQVALVAYTGRQLPGFTVSTIPAGYVLQSSISDALEIAKPGNHSSANTFEGKLLVSLLSSDATASDYPGAPVTVNGHSGTISTDKYATVLTYSDGTHEIQLQSWHNVGLDKAQLVDFAQGVRVTGSAVAPKG